MLHLFAIGHGEGNSDSVFNLPLKFGFDAHQYGKCKLRVLTGIETEFSVVAFLALLRVDLNS